MKNNKCPECGKNHRSIRTAMECMSPLQFRINWIIIVGTPGTDKIPEDLRNRHERMKEFIEPLSLKFKVKMEENNR